MLSLLFFWLRFYISLCTPMSVAFLFALCLPIWPLCWAIPTSTVMHDTLSWSHDTRKAQVDTGFGFSQVSCSPRNHYCYIDLTLDKYTRLSVEMNTGKQDIQLPDRMDTCTIGSSCVIAGGHKAIAKIEWLNSWKRLKIGCFTSTDDYSEAMQPVRMWVKVQCEEYKFIP